MKKRTSFLVKWLKISCVTAFFLVGVFFLIQKKPTGFDGRRVVWVDTVGKNHLFRGSNPFVVEAGETVFAYNALTSYFNKALQQAGQQKVDDFALVVLSLLDLDQYQEIKKEKKFFEEYPHQGSFIWASTISPGLLLSESGPKLITDHYNASITQTLYQIRHLLEKQSDRPVVIYVHCNAGRDRTGFMIAAYRMLFHNETFKDVNLQNTAEVGRSSEGFYQDAILSYDSYVRETIRRGRNTFKS